VTALHIRFGNANPAQKLAQLGQVLGGFLRGAQIGLGDHFHQRHAAAVKVHQAFAVLNLGFAGILFQVQFVDAHPPASAVRPLQVHVTALANRLVKLGNLVAFRQVRVEVVFAIKVRDGVDFRVHGGSQQRAFAHRFGIQDGQHAWQAAAHRADVGVWLCSPGIGFAGAKNLAGGIKLNVGFKSNDDLVSFHALTSLPRKACGIAPRHSAFWVACS